MNSWSSRTKRKCRSSRVSVCRPWRRKCVNESRNWKWRQMFTQNSRLELPRSKEDKILSPFANFFSFWSFNTSMLAELSFECWSSFLFWILLHFVDSNKERKWNFYRLILSSVVGYQIIPNDNFCGQVTLSGDSTLCSVVQDGSVDRCVVTGIALPWELRKKWPLIFEQLTIFFIHCKGRKHTLRRFISRNKTNFKFVS